MKSLVRSLTALKSMALKPAVRLLIDSNTAKKPLLATDSDPMVLGLAYSARKKTRAPTIQRNMLAVMIILVSRVNRVNRFLL